MKFRLCLERSILKGKKVYYLLGSDNQLSVIGRHPIRMHMWTNGFNVVIDVEFIRQLEIVAGVAIDKDVSFRNHLAVTRVITRWMLEHINREQSFFCYSV